MSSMNNPNTNFIISSIIEFSNSEFAIATIRNNHEMICQSFESNKFIDREFVEKLISSFNFKTDDDFDFVDDFIEMNRIDIDKSKFDNRPYQIRYILDSEIE